MSKKFEIFISYRRKGGYDTAKLLYDRLRLDGYSVSFDIDTLVNGDFDNELENRVNECKDFLLVLSPGIFDRLFVPDPDYDPENDWVRREIAQALKANKNIIPLYLEGFVFPKNLPDDIKNIARKNAIDLYPKYFEAAYEKMKSFLNSKPSWRVKHQKKMISVVAAILLAFAGFLFYQVQETEKTHEQKIEAERERTLDSIRQIREQRRLQERTYHWQGDNDIGQVIFEKIAAAGVQKTECSGNSGRLLTLNLDNFNCRGGAEIICSYAPRVYVASCNNRRLEILDMRRLRSEPKQDTAAAKEDLINKLREADFSAWISKIEQDFNLSERRE
ncbi:MAG: toll/interleukin-1 receptor domain-containing protein [Fibromonadaceae bacterium]|nr:toll/interleukin-1 receptor domain-containing protein [Fibromonadaceae bacterium]